MTSRAVLGEVARAAAATAAALRSAWSAFDTQDNTHNSETDNTAPSSKRTVPHYIAQELNMNTPSASPSPSSPLPPLPPSPTALSMLRSNARDASIPDQQPTPLRPCGIGSESFSMVEKNTCSPQDCFPYEFICNGTTISALNATTDIFEDSSCALKSALCHERIIVFSQQFNYPEGSCIISKHSNSSATFNTSIEITCQDSRKFGGQFSGFECSTNYIKCPSLGEVDPSLYGIIRVPLDCQNLVKPCDTMKYNLTLDCNSTNCGIIVNDATLSTSYCNATLNSSICSCPDDRLGESCESSRPLTCEIAFKNDGSENSPEQTYGCQPFNPDDHKDRLITGGIRPCFFVSNKQVQAKLKYQLTCSFKTQPSTPRTEFSYWMNTPNFRISRQESWALAVRAFDFIHFSDESMIFKTPIQMSQMNGTEIIEVNLNLGSISDDFWLSHRLYTETRVVHTDTTDFPTSPLDSSQTRIIPAKVIIDLPDPPFKKVLSAGAIAGIIVGSIAFVSIIALGVWLKLRPQKKKVTKTE